MNSREKVKILLVEDNPMLLGIHEAMITEAHSKPDIAATGQDALEKVKQNIYDLIFMDIGLPDIDGIETTEKIRQLEAASKAGGRKKAAIIGLTAYDLEEVEEECLAAGMNTVVSKPIKQETIEQLIALYAPKKIHLSIVKTPVDFAIIEKNSNKKILAMLVESLSQFRSEMNEALQHGDMKTLAQIVHKTYGALCYTPTPQLKEVVKKFKRALENNIAEIEHLYKDVIKALDKFEAAYQALRV